MNELALFAGAGGGILGGVLSGWRTVAAVEIEEYPRAVLLQRQADGILPRFPIWDDVTTFDGKPWRGKVDVVSGGFPCQDISAAGKGAGITGERSGLWSEMARIIGEVRPRFALMENSPMLVSRGLGTVLGDLAEMGYDARWCVLGAVDAGAPHRRKRIWILAYTNNSGQGERCQYSGWTESYGQCHWWDIDPADLPDSENERILLGKRGGWDGKRSGQSGADRRGDAPEYAGREWWSTESRLGRVVDELAGEMDELGGVKS